MSLALLAFGDVLMIGLFVLLGERDHAISDPQPVLRWLITSAEFALPWLIVSWLLGAYRLNWTTCSLLLQTINAWFIAAPLGALARSFVNGSGAIVSLFLVVALLVGGAMLLIWRWVFAWLMSRRATSTA
ncbi:MAG TPA: DUF3054 family protein [Anaerolineae bacterium]